jgi:hypothetical protein
MRQLFASKRANSAALLLGIGPMGQAVHKILGGSIEESASVIFAITLEHPEFGAQQVADAVRSKIRRDNGSHILSGRSNNKRIARLATGAPVVSGVARGVARGVEIEEIDYSSDPNAILSCRDMLEFCDTQKGEDIIKRAAAIQGRIDELCTQAADELAEKSGVRRRQAFYIKKGEMERLQFEIEGLRQHFLWAMENGITKISGQEIAAHMSISRAIQAEFEFI